MLATSNMSDQNLWGHGRHGHFWQPHQHLESGTGSPALASLIFDGMMGHVPFNLCKVHELSRIKLYIRQQALFTLIQQNPAQWSSALQPQKSMQRNGHWMTTTMTTVIMTMSMIQPATVRLMT